MAPCPAGLWGCPGTSGAWGRAEMLLCWLGGSPSLPPWQGELRIEGLQEAAGSAPRRSRRGGWWVLGGDNPVTPEAPEGLPGLGPLTVVPWIPNSLCVSLEGEFGSWLLAGGAPASPIPHFLPACGRNWDCPAPPSCAAFQPGTHEVGVLLAVSWCCCSRGVVAQGPPA